MDSRDVTPLMLAEEIAQKIKSGEMSRYNQAIMILLDTNKENYSTAVLVAGMSVSEGVALLEIIKTDFIDTLREVEDDTDEPWRKSLGN